MWVMPYCPYGSVQQKKIHNLQAVEKEAAEQCTKDLNNPLLLDTAQLANSNGARKLVPQQTFVVAWPLQQCLQFIWTPLIGAVPDDTN